MTSSLLAKFARGLKDGESPIDIMGAGPLAGFRNKIGNGDFEVAQRGTSLSFAAGLGAGSYTLDQWSYRGANGTGNAVTISQLDLPSGYAGIPAYVRKYLRFNRTATGSSLTAIQNRIENVRTLAGKRSTLTFYTRGVTAGIGKSLEIQVAQSFGTGGSPSAGVPVPLDVTSIALPGDFVRHDVIADFPSIPLGTVYGTNSDDHVQVTFVLPVAAGNCAFDLAHVSLVEGDARNEADPSAPRRLLQELELCQWYARPAGIGGVGKAVGPANGTVAYAHGQMRATPTATVIAGSGTSALIKLVGTYENASNFTGVPLGPSGGFIQFVGSGYATNETYMLAKNVIFLSAEL